MQAYMYRILSNNDQGKLYCDSNFMAQGLGFLCQGVTIVVILVQN